MLQSGFDNVKRVVPCACDTDVHDCSCVEPGDAEIRSCVMNVSKRSLEECLCDLTETKSVKVVLISLAKMGLEHLSRVGPYCRFRDCR